LKTKAVVKSIRQIKVKLQETIKPNISNKTKNIVGVDRVEQFMQKRKVTLLYLTSPLWPLLTYLTCGVDSCN